MNFEEFQVPEFSQFTNEQSQQSTNPVAQTTTGKKLRTWIGTLNNPGDWESIITSWWERGKLQWLVGQLEVGESGTPHIQFVASFPHTVTFKYAKEYFGTSTHLEGVKDVAAAITYCQKEETRVAGPLTFGKLPKSSSRQQLTAKQALGLTEQQKLELPVSQYLAVHKLQQVVSASAQASFAGPRKGFWIYGDSGIGKSRYVKSLSPYIKPSNKWWDGYSQQSVVLIDDFERDGLKYLGHYLKLWGDPYGLLYGEVKGSQIALNFQEIYITSNYSIDECVEAAGGDQQLKDALKRRFHELNFNYPIVLSLYKNW